MVACALFGARESGSEHSSEHRDCLDNPRTRHQKTAALFLVRFNRSAAGNEWVQPIELKENHSISSPRSVYS